MAASSRPATFLQRELKDAIDGGSDAAVRAGLQVGAAGARAGAGPSAAGVSRVGRVGPGPPKIFSVEVVVSGEVLGVATGRAKKEAEQDAARQALVRLDDSVRRRRTHDGRPEGRPLHSDVEGGLQTARCPSIDLDDAPALAVVAAAGFDAGVGELR